jgi:hypothetical protein
MTQLASFSRSRLRNDRSVGGRGMDDEEVEAKPGDRRLDPDLGRTEPILELAAVEQHLQRADRQAQSGKAEEIERLAAAVTHLVHEDQDADRRETPTGRLM